MKLAMLIEMREGKEQRKPHNLTELLSPPKKVEIVIGRRDSRLSATEQADILLGEDEKGEPNVAPVVLRGMLAKQAVIGYDAQGDSYYVQDLSNGTTTVNGELFSALGPRTLRSGDNLTFGKYNYPVKFLQGN